MCLITGAFQWSNYIMSPAWEEDSNNWLDMIYVTMTEYSWWMASMHKFNGFKEHNEASDGECNVLPSLLHIFKQSTYHKPWVTARMFLGAKRECSSHNITCGGLRACVAFLWTSRITYKR